MSHFMHVITMNLLSIPKYFDLKAGEMRLQVASFILAFWQLSAHFGSNVAQVWVMSDFIHSLLRKFLFLMQSSFLFAKEKVLEIEG